MCLLFQFFLLPYDYSDSLQAGAVEFSVRPRTGCSRLEILFSAPLPEDIRILIFSEHPSVMSVSGQPLSVATSYETSQL